MSSDVKKIETLAVVFIILAVLTRISSLGMETWMASIFGASRQMEALTTQGRVMLTLWNFVRVMVDIGVGIWLFISAGKDGRARWVWALFGLTGGLIAAVLYVLVDIAATLKAQKRE